MFNGTGKFDFLNLGSGKEYSIKDLLKTLSSFIKFEYKFDNTKDVGFTKRVMSIKNAKKVIGYKPKTSLLAGLKKTWEWFLKNKDQNSMRHNYFSKKN
jgi:GDP-L-fucose synthase